jgi:hypothetical protein
MAEKSPIPTPDLDKTAPAGRTSPYGPHRGAVDEAAGGADSSPHEGEASAPLNPPPADAPAMPPNDPRDVPASRTQSIPPSQTDPDDQAAG